MPRPGPRPYECMKRVWHSDRHQPMRGLLIQEIFRIVCEIHSSSTKKNKEWQEKLPVVVLKVEEIMYSKANSEAEYMDIKTLLDRTNDAINTIIRLDETTETDEFLQPCIEAALHLGCTPRRASRSERSLNPGCYLSQEPNNIDTLSRYHMFMKSSAHVTILRNSKNPPAEDAHFAPNKFPFSIQSGDLRPSKENPFEKCPSSSYSIYPLCYSFRVPSMPISNQLSEPSKPDSHFKDKANALDIHEEMTVGGCDLSLRLGPFGENSHKLSDPKAALCSNRVNLVESSFSGQIAGNPRFPWQSNLR